LSAIKKIFLSAALSIGHESGITSTGATPEFLPLSQTNFLPDLIQVKVLFPTTDLLPTLVHLAPALVAECAGISGRDNESESIDKIAISLLFIYKA
jgi:hypothetical protein